MQTSLVGCHKTDNTIPINRCPFGRCAIIKAAVDKVKDDIKEKGLSVDEVYDRATWRRMSSYIEPT